MNENNDIKIKLIRSNRKSLSITVKDGEIIARAPLRMSLETIQKFIKSRESWISEQLMKSEKRKEKAEDLGYLSAEEIKELAEKALCYIPKRVSYYAEKLGVTYGRITIRNQKSKWGSCTQSGNLNFNCLLMLTPDEVIDSVVVHELCHRKEMNHSKNFYALVYSVYPDYDRCDKWLKENGSVIMERMMGGK